MNPPYAADTRAKGWRFELDHERIRQSDTWALAPADLRPWLLMLWMVAWEQTPCGSLPDDDALVAARIGMAPRAFAKARETLLRGWVAADDGRLYHATVTERVRAMLVKRAKDAERAANNRARSGGVTGVSRVTNTRLPREPDPSSTPSTKHQAPETSPDGEVARKRATPPRPSDVPEQVWTDWLALRKTKRAPVTATVLADAVEEAKKAGMTLAEFLAKWCSRGSQGLEASWLAPQKGAPPNRQLAIEAENRRVAAAFLEGQPT